MTAIKYCLANLLNFEGNDTRSTFWFYMIFVVISYIILSILCSLPYTTAMLGDAVTLAQSGLTEKAMIEQAVNLTVKSMEPLALIGLIVTAITIFLFAAAFNRRLNDGGMPSLMLWLVIFLLLITPILQYVFINEQLTHALELTKSQMVPGTVLSPEAQSFYVRAMYFQIPQYIGYLLVIIMGVMKSR